MAFLAIPFLAQILTLIAVLFAVFIFLRLGKKVIMLAINGFFGILGLLIVNFLPFIEIPINIWIVLIAGLGGIAGIAILVILNLLGIGF